MVVSGGVCGLVALQIALASSRTSLKNEEHSSGSEGYSTSMFNARVEPTNSINQTIYKNYCIPQYHNLCSDFSNIKL